MNRFFASVFLLLACTALPPATAQSAPGSQSPPDPFLLLMKRAQQHAQAHGSQETPVLSPEDTLLLGDHPPIHVNTLHAAGFKVVPWTTDTPANMKALIALGVDGIITDRPDLLRQVVAEERATGNKLQAFDLSAHRGGRGLRPENTLPSFESGMDQGATTLETDTGVTTDGVSLIWHDQFLNPQSCRRQDGAPYTLQNRVYTKDISMADAQNTFVCDKLYFGADQKNDLSLSPVAVAFAAQEKLASPYVPTSAGQLFQFVKFYTAYYRSGAGKASPHAAERAATGARVRFNLETKIMPGTLPEVMIARLPPNTPPDLYQNHTVGPEAFVQALCGAIVRNGVVDRSEIQSFDFRTLILVEQQYPALPTYYLTESVKLLSTDFTPESLRLTPSQTR